MLGWRTLPKHLGARRLVKSGSDPTPPDRLKNPGRAEGGGISRILRHLETHLNVTLGPEVVDLFRPKVVDQVGELLLIGQIAVVEEESSLRIVGIPVEMIDPTGVEGARPPDHPVHLISLCEKEFS
jgi:hypothetical protein